MIEIDGSLGEGGGQVLRTSLTLSAVLKKPVHIFNIRAKRSKPGLQPQHFTGVNALAQITSARVKGLARGSRGLLFEPGEIRGGNYFFDIGTAGSVVLVLQAVLPLLLFANEKSEVKIRGGTHVSRAPNFHYFQNVFLPALAKFGVRCDAKLMRYGFFPKGGGEVKVSIEPVRELRGFEFLKREESGINAIVCSGNLPLHVSEREKAEILRNFPDANVRREDVRDVSCPGNALTIYSGFIGASSLGERGKSAESVAREACEKFRSELESGAVVDKHLADQLLLYAALAKGRSAFRTSEITLHAKTNMGIIEKFIGRKFEIKEKEVLLL